MKKDAERYAHLKYLSIKGVLVKDRSILRGVLMHLISYRIWSDDELCPANADNISSTLKLIGMLIPLLLCLEIARPNLAYI